MLKNKFLINKEKGITLYFAVVIMTLLLALALGITSILIGQIKITKGMSDSVIAFYAGDTGIEHAMYEYFVKGTSFSQPYVSGTITVSGGTDRTYSVNAYSRGNPEDKCPSSSFNYYCFESFGQYQNTERAIKVNR